MSAVALSVLPGCTPVEVAPPHTQITAPHMLSPLEEERKREGEARGERRRREDYRLTCQDYHTETNMLLINMTSSLHHHYMVCIDLQSVVSC